MAHQSRLIDLDGVIRQEDLAKPDAALALGMLTHRLTGHGAVWRHLHQAGVPDMDWPAERDPP